MLLRRYDTALFHHGEYLGTTLSRPTRGHPEVERLTDAVIKVGYIEENWEDRESYGLAVSHFRWDPKNASVKHAGQVPSADGVGVEGDPPSGPIEIIGSPHAGAGGRAPYDAKSPTTFFSYGLADIGTSAVFTSPSGNVGCALYFEGAYSCGSDAMAGADEYGRAEVGALSVAGSMDGEMPVLGSVTEAQEWHLAQEDGAIQVLEWLFGHLVGIRV